MEPVHAIAIRARRAALAAGLTLVSATAAWAEEAAAPPSVDTGDTAWVLAASALVLMMTLPGLALFYGGLVRAKNVLNVLMQCVISAGVVGVLWILVGYSLAFGTGNAYIGDLSKFALNGVSMDSVVANFASPPRNIPESCTCRVASRPWWRHSWSASATGSGRIRCRPTACRCAWSGQVCSGPGGSGSTPAAHSARARSPRWRSST